MSHDYDFDPSELDEFLVEYVDGTMDPVVRKAFEDFLRVYPEIRAQVDCLSSVRTQLCRLGDDCRCKAPPGFQDRLKRQLAGETQAVADSLEHLAPQLNMMALAFSITILAFAIALSHFSQQDLFADSAVEKTTEVLAAEKTDRNDGLEESERDLLTVSHVHQMSTATTFASAFDQPVLLSVRRDFVAMKPAVMSVAP